jgi:hypothetical protein
MAVTSQVSFCTAVPGGRRSALGLASGRRPLRAIRPVDTNKLVELEREEIRTAPKNPVSIIFYKKEEERVL